MRYIIIALKGVVYGITHILPGLGGGIALLMMGIYEPFVEAVGNFFTDRQSWGRYLRFLIPLGVGMVIGIVLAAKILAGLFESYPTATNVFLMGLLLGTIPGIIRLHGDMRPRVDRMVAAVIGIAVVIGLNVLEARISDGSGLTLADLNRLPGAAYNLLISVLGGGASVTPGLDGSMVLILGGTYKPILDIVKHPMLWLANWIPLACTALGVVVGIVAFSKSIDALIKRSPSLAYYGVLGLVLGSVWALRPTQAPNVAWWVLVLALLAGIAVAVALGGREPEVE